MVLSNIRVALGLLQLLGIAEDLGEGRGEGDVVWRWVLGWHAHERLFDAAVELLEVAVGLLDDLFEEGGRAGGGGGAGGSGVFVWAGPAKERVG